MKNYLIIFISALLLVGCSKPTVVSAPEESSIVYEYQMDRARVENDYEFCEGDLDDIHTYVDCGRVIQMQFGEDFCYECDANFSMMANEDPEYGPVYKDSNVTIYRELIDMDLSSGEHFYSDHMIMIDWEQKQVTIAETY